ncbi:MAG: TetR/AcrR family transcriptional regulator [Candidatus Dadabacteria bacterium]|nr:MAG: TetR/AcrR family transcriptional regulator [Candidatus Dadabacteria bacterium]
MSRSSKSASGHRTRGATSGRGRRRKGIELRRLRILEAARRIIVEEGVDALSMRKLADRADLVVKTLYNLYGSKEGILTAIIEQGTASIDEAFSQAPAEGLPGFLRLLSTIEQAVLENADILKPAIVASFHQSGVRDATAVAMHNRRIATVADVLRQGQERGLFRPDFDLDLAAAILYRNYINTVADWAFDVIDADQYRILSRYNTLATACAFVADEHLPVMRQALALLEQGSPPGD